MLERSMVAFALLGAEWVLYLLAILSVLSVAIMFERGIFYARRRMDVTGLRAGSSAPRGGRPQGPPGRPTTRRGPRRGADRTKPRGARQAGAAAGGLAAGSRLSGDDHGGIRGINVPPLVHILLVVLIIF